MTTSDTSKPVARTAPPVPAVISTLQDMAASIPSGGETTGQLAILDTIVAASKPTGLSAPWETTGTETILGRMIEVHSLKRMPSDYPTGLGFFLVVTAADADTGEAITFTTGSASVAAQLVKAHATDWLPIKCKLVESEKPTKSGYKPQHLVVFGPATAL